MLFKAAATDFIEQKKVEKQHKWGQWEWTKTAKLWIQNNESKDAERPKLQTEESSDQLLI